MRASVRPSVRKRMGARTRARGWVGERERWVCALGACVGSVRAWLAGWVGDWAGGRGRGCGRGCGRFVGWLVFFLEFFFEGGRLPGGGAVQGQEGA